MRSKVRYEVHGDTLQIIHPDWERIAFATIREDYTEEIQSVAWSKRGEYLYSNKFQCYLHIYIMKKWYGNKVYEHMKGNGYVVDHMDRNGFNCRINNLCFLTSDENIAKGHTVDKMNRDKSHIALSFFKDFETQNIQMTICFNYPAIAKISTLKEPAAIETAYLLYDCEYEMVINDARTILYNYKREHIFQPEMLHHSDYHIEGVYGTPCPIENYDRYIEGGHGHTVFFMNELAPITGWRVEEQRQFFHLRGNPQQE